MPIDSPEVHKAKVDGWIRLFTYVQEVEKEVGEEKALELLSEIQTQEYKKWFKENSSKLDLSGPPLLAAYKMLFETILNRELSEIDIVEYTENRIVHNYDLPCVILEACVELGLDTKKICKAIHQKPVNTLMQLVDPRLRFDRDYQKIRPYVDSCVEIFWFKE